LAGERVAYQVKRWSLHFRYCHLLLSHVHLLFGSLNSAYVGLRVHQLYFYLRLEWWVGEISLHRQFVCLHSSILYWWVC